MRIIADIHEKESMVIPEVIGKGIEVEIKKLQVGDYIISDDIAIERKTMNDFLSSMMSKRIVNQLINLKNNYKKPLVIIETSEDHELYTSDAHPNLNKNAIKGMILSTIFEFQIPILLTRDYKETADFIALLAKRQERGKQEISLKAKRHAFTIQEQQQLILESFPVSGRKQQKKF